MGCDTAEGYLISRPLAESRLQAWLRARTVLTPTTDRQQQVLTLLG